MSTSSSFFVLNSFDEKVGNSFLSREQTGPSSLPGTTRRRRTAGSSRSNLVVFSGLILLVFQLLFVAHPVASRSATTYLTDSEELPDSQRVQQPPVEISSDGDGNNDESAAEKPTAEAKCNIYENKTLYVLMDRICELCHEMFNHERPNTRAECRSGCFQNDSFKRCLHLFRPSKHHGRNRSWSKQQH